MATCANCGKEIRDDVWTCGSCGAPVAQSTAGDTGGSEASAYGSEGYNPYAGQAAAGTGAYGSTTTSYGSSPEGLTPYGTPLPRTAPPRSGGLSGTTKLILAAAAVALIAIVAVWFFVLRGGGGDEFVGTWTAAESGQGSLVIERDDGGLQVTLVGADQQRIGPLKTDLSGDELEIKLEATGDDEQQKTAVEMVKALFEATIQDFKMALRIRDADGRLLLTVSGKPKLGGQDETTQVSEYVKGAAGQTI
jgi:hypothetical protein